MRCWHVATFASHNFPQWRVIKNKSADKRSVPRNLLHGKLHMKTDRPAASETAEDIVRHVKSKGYRVGDPIPPAVLLGAKVQLDITNVETNAGIDYAKSKHWIEDVPMSHTLCLTYSGWAQV